MLTIEPATTVDSGRYSCCGSSGDDSACTSSTVTVSWSDPDPPDPTEQPIQQLSCFDYPDESPGICERYLNHKPIHAQTLQGKNRGYFLHQFFCIFTLKILLFLNQILKFRKIFFGVKRYTRKISTQYIFIKFKLFSNIGN